MKLGIISWLQAHHCFHGALSDLSTLCKQLFARIGRAKAPQGHLLALLTCSASPPRSPLGEQSASAAVLSALLILNHFFPMLFPESEPTPSFLLAPIPGVQVAAFHGQNAFQDGLYLPGLTPSLVSPSDSEWHCPTLHLTTGSSERGFFGSWCSCDLGSPGKTKSSLRAGAGSSSSLVSPRQGSAHSGRSKLLIA